MKNKKLKRIILDAYRNDYAPPIDNGLISLYDEVSIVRKKNIIKSHKNKRAILAYAALISMFFILAFVLIYDNLFVKNTNVLESPKDNESYESQTFDTTSESIIVLPDDLIVYPDYSISYNWDYRYSSISDLYENADIVLIGKYIETTKTTFSSEIGRFISTASIDVESIIKGDAGITDSVINFYGGEMSVRDFINQNGKEVSEKYIDADLNSENVMNSTIGEQINEYSILPKMGCEYLVFLSYDDGKYFVLCDSYGMREINSEKSVWNPDSSEFEKTNIITED